MNLEARILELEAQVEHLTKLINAKLPEPLPPTTAKLVALAKHDKQAAIKEAKRLSREFAKKKKKGAATSMLGKQRRNTENAHFRQPSR